MTAAEGIQDPSVVRRYGTLLAIAESVATHRELPDLLHDLISRLRQVEGFDYLEFALYDSNRSVLRHQWITSESATPLEDISLEGNAAGEVFRSQEPLVIADTTQDPRFDSLEGIPPEIRSIYFCPQQTARGCFGVVGFGSKSVTHGPSLHANFCRALPTCSRLRLTKTFLATKSASTKTSCHGSESTAC